MNLEEFKSEYFEQDKIFQSLINPGVPYTEIAPQQSAFITDLIYKALKSEDKDQIIEFLAFLIYAGSTQEVVAKLLHVNLNTLIEKFNQLSDPSNQVNNLSNQLEVTNKLLRDVANDAIREMGKKGGEAKALKNKVLKCKVAELLNLKKYPSKRNAAKEIKEVIIKLARESGLSLSDDQAEVTIATWITELELGGEIQPITRKINTNK